MILTIHFDGGSRGNPGPAAAGVVVYDPDMKPVFEAGYFLGDMTNNGAEYHALLKALDVAAAWPDAELALRSDSELLVRQITGEYRVKNSQLAVLYEQAQRLLLRRDHWHIRHVKRELNVRADELANRAMDAVADVVIVDQRPKEAPPAARTARRGGNGQPADSSPRAESADDAPTPAPDSELAARIRRVEAECTTAPAARVCPSPCAADECYFFSTCGPQNLCLDALSAMLNTVLALRDAPLTPGQALPPLTTRCARPGCGAAFEVRVSR